MASAKEFREALLAGAYHASGFDLDYRAKAFVAFVIGYLGPCHEREVVTALRRLVNIPEKPPQAVDHD